MLIEGSETFIVLIDGLKYVSCDVIGISGVKIWSKIFVHVEVSMPDVQKGIYYQK